MCKQAEKRAEGNIAFAFAFAFEFEGRPRARASESERERGDRERSERRKDGRKKRAIRLFLEPCRGPVYVDSIKTTVSVLSFDRFRGELADKWQFPCWRRDRNAPCQRATRLFALVLATVGE